MRRVLQALEQRAITATKAEVDLLISEASISIQEYIEDNASLTELKHSIGLLRKASSTLQIMQIHGGVMLIDETVKLIAILVAGKAERVEEAQDVVSRSIIRLGEYLGHVEAGNKDVPLALMPLLNDLRAARGAALLSENVLFFPNIDGVDAPEIIIRSNEKADDTWLRRVRSNFQKTLLACVSGKDIPTASAQLCKLSIRLQRTSQADASQKLWWLASALAQAVAINALPFNASIASLFNALDKQIKLLIELGEQDFANNINENIVKNILYYIAIADNRGRIVNQVKQLYKLNEQIPQHQEMDELRQQISAPSSEVMITVSKALLEDVASAKDCIELYIHSGMQEQMQIDRLYSGLQRISDTLSMIGIEEYKSKAEQQIKEVELLKSEGQSDDELVLLGVSEVILEIETCINNFIDYRINFQAADHQPEDSGIDDGQHDNEHKAAFNVTISEVLLRIEQTKELLTDVIHIEYDEDKTLRCVQYMREISGVISVINLDAPISLVEGITSYLSAEQFKRDADSEGDALRDLADCMVGLQCYFEQLESRVPYAEQILEHCEDSLARISQLTEGVIQAGQAQDNQHDQDGGDSQGDDNRDSLLELDLGEAVVVSGDDLALVDEFSPEAETPLENSVKLTHANELNNDAVPEDVLENELEGIAVDHAPEADVKLATAENSALEIDIAEIQDLSDFQGEPELSETGLSESSENTAAAENNEQAKSDSLSVSDVAQRDAGLVVLTGEADPVLVETFIEEAEQVVADLKKYWDIWQQNPTNWDSFAVMRRGYHTLKGSGRFVGAELLSEFGWQCENLCNKCLGKKESIAELKHQLLQQAVDSAPALVEQLKSPQQQVDPKMLAFIEQLKQVSADIGTTTAAAPEQAKKPAIEATQVKQENASEAEPEIGEQDLDKQEPVDQSEILKKELTGIFTVEATQHLKVMRDAIGEDNVQSVEIRIDEKLLRTVHTMRGSARTAGIKHISDLCGPLEEIIRLAIKHDIQFADEQTQLVQSCVQQIESDLEKMEQSLPLDDFDTVIAEQLQSLNNTLKNEYAGDTNTPYAENNDAGAAALPGMVDVAQGRDEELCEIFYEEAEDLLSECQVSSQKLKADETRSHAISELQRQFHTLKGSSRMAGLTTIGELSHVTEGLLIALSVEVAEVSVAAKLMQKVLDELYAKVELAQRGEDISLNEQLVTELKRASSAEEDDSAQQDEMPLDADHTNIQEQQVIASDQVTTVDLGELLSAGANQSANVPAIDLSQPAKNWQLDSASEETSEQEEIQAQKDEQPKPALKAFTQVQRIEDVVGTPTPSLEKQEVVRVPAGVLDGLVNDAGEVNIQHARLEQVFNSFVSNSNEFEQTIGRLREQLRKLDIETEAHILYKHAEDQKNSADFDPLELDRYSDIQQLSRSLAESVDDLSNIREMFLKNIQDGEDVFVNQKVVTTSLQESLLDTRMIRFDTIEPRLQRIVRQTSGELNKKVNLLMEGGDIEVDRRVLNGVITSIEHILRNSVSHGIEASDKRKQMSKPDRGQIEIDIAREGSEISITIKDDGAGINPEKVKAKAIENGLIAADANVSDEEVLQLIFKPGLSTANTVSKIAGRGVGMDIVDKDVRRMGGNIETRSALNKGAKFILKLPFTLAVSHALLVRAGKEVYALTLSGVEGVIQLGTSELKEIFSQPTPAYAYAGHNYSFHHLASLLQTDSLYFKDDDAIYPVILVRMGDQRLALQVDATLGNKEIVVKPLAPHFSHSQGLSGATILADGSVALILDIPWIARLTQASHSAVVISDAPQEESDEDATVMVVDDSITIRKVTTRFLERNNYKVVTAKDGVDALQKMQNTIPDVVLLDIEMPRMDGYELATQMRKEPRLAGVPIIMITSRTGDKHRSRAMELGVNCYLGKPYNEAQLLESIREY